MIRTAILYIILIFGVIPINAQNNNVEIARSEFRKGNYKDAVGLYNGAIALAKNSEEKNLLNLEKEKSSKCWKYLDEAERCYIQSNYKAALRLYSSIIALNSTDSYSKKRMSLCQNHIAKEEYLAREKVRINNVISNLLKLNDIDKIRAFIKEYPLHSSKKDLEEILDYYENPESFDKKTVSDKQYLFVKYGNLYFENNKSVSSFFYEKAASCGSLVAFYNLALSLPDSETNRRKRLLAFAAANGNQSSAKLLNSKYPNTKYNTEKAQKLYYLLNQANKGSLYSKVYCQKHKIVLGLQNLDLINDDTDYVSDDSGILYELALMYANGDYVNKNVDKSHMYLYKAASLGNHVAQYQLAMIQTQSKSKKALMLCAAINGNESAYSHYNDGLKYAKEYVKYLCNKKCDWFDVKMFMSFYANKYEIVDLDARLISMACYKHLDRKGAKETIRLLKSQRIWDIETIRRIKINFNTFNPNRHHKKILKQISKVQSAKNIKKSGCFQQLIRDGYCDNPHTKYQISIVDFL
ncbi:sel1 repeat family protein [Bacteroides faecalis]|uniref:Uncharacterized protein n=1 Tax=Bacteroides faecalis TaxID=2447885 RepID=A0A401LQ50_9BACE|nr:sel1 repeat family protein [Bacteroides faecalis]GCB33678.1 hypothetical protein KGMB02408_06230 [Bacteroides faecalis]